MEGYIERDCEITGEIIQFLPGFQDYVMQEYKLHHPGHWTRVINMYSTNDAEAFDTFYKLLDDFLDKCSSQN